MSVTPRHLQYRPDIDGLRAVAVIAVVIFHAFPNMMRGGFTGVDVFFVISGFLITSIILENLAHGTFSFRDFYIRRIRRIFPALVVVLIATYLFGWFTLLVVEFSQLGKHVAGGSAFASNFLLWREVGYFDGSAETKPLLHLWSLGIEEQFYFVWPILIWAAWRHRVNLILLMAGIVIASFALNVISVRYDKIAAFYSPLTRFWELVCGGVLSAVMLERWQLLGRNGATRCAVIMSAIKSNSVLQNGLAGVGLLCLAAAFWGINKDMRFPGVWAVFPVMGACLLVLTPLSFVNRHILSHRVMIGLGLISFPLYLWHWPVLSFLRILEGGPPSLLGRCAAIALSVGLAWLTFTWVEKPIRFGRFRQFAVKPLVGALGVMGVIGLLTYVGQGFEQRRVVQLNPTIDSGQDGGDRKVLISGCGVIDSTIQSQLAVCAQQDQGVVPFALMGDSKAGALYGGLVRTAAPSRGWLIIGGNGPFGAPVPLLSADPDPNRPLTNAAIAAILANQNVKIVVLATAMRVLFDISDGAGGNLANYDYHYWQKLQKSERFEAAYTELSRVIEKLISGGKQVVLLVDNPALPNPQDCIGRKTALPLIHAMLGHEKDRYNPDCFVSLDRFLDQARPYLALLAKVKAKYPAVMIFDPTPIYCDLETRRCDFSKNGRLMYAYTDHISDYAAGLVGAELNAFVNHLILTHSSGSQ